MSNPLSTRDSKQVSEHTEAPHFKQQTTQVLLHQITAELKRIGLWSSVAPSSQALASTAPFCVDTLSFTDWLQFVFIVKMHQLLDMNLTLPVNMAIAPMAEEAWKNTSIDTQPLLALLISFDQLLSE